MSDGFEGHLSPSGTFAGTIEQGEAPLVVKYIIEREMHIPPEIDELHAELNLAAPLWAKSGQCVVEEIDLDEEVVFSGCGNRVAMLSLFNPDLGVLHFIWDAKTHTLCGGDEFWEPGSPPTVFTRQASNAHLGGGAHDEIQKANEEIDSKPSASADLESPEERTSSWTKFSPSSRTIHLQAKADPETRAGNPAVETRIGADVDQFPSNPILAARGDLASLKLAYLAYNKEEHDELLCQACSNGQADTVEWLLNKNKDSGSASHYFEALGCRNVSAAANVIKILKTRIQSTDLVLAQCAAGSNVQALQNLLPFSGSLTPAVVSASKNGRAGCLQMLLEAKANPNAGYPLHAACKSGRQSIIRMLAQLVSSDEKDEDGLTPMDYLRIHNHDHLIPVLQESRKTPRRRRIR